MRKLSRDIFSQPHRMHVPAEHYSGTPLSRISLYWVPVAPDEIP